MKNQKTDSLLIVPDNYAPQGGGGGGAGGVTTLTEIINLIQASPASFYLDTTLKNLVNADIQAALNNWINSPTNSFKLDIATIKNDIISLNAGVQKNATDIATLKSTVNNYITTNDVKITNLTKDIASANTLITKIINGVDVDVINLKTLDQRITTVDGKIKTVSDSITALSNDLKPKVTKVENDIIALSGRVLTNENSINGLTSDLANYINSNDANITTINTTLGTLNTEVNTLKISVNTMENKVATFDAFFDDAASTLTITKIQNSLNTLTASITNIQNQIDAINVTLTDHKQRIETIEDWITVHQPLVDKITPLETLVNNHETKIIDIDGQINGALESGFLKQTWVYSAITAAENKKSDGSDWTNANVFPVGAKVTYDSLLPVLLSRINDVDSKSGPSELRLTTLETKANNLETRVAANETNITAMSTEINKIPILETSVTGVETDITGLKDKTIKIDIDGDMLSEALKLDQVLTESYNTSASGSSYVGDQLIKPNQPATRLNVEDVFKAFYKRIDDILTMIVAIDVTTIETDILNLQTALTDLTDAYNDFVTETDDKFLNLNDTQMIATLTETESNEFDTGESYTGALAYNTTTDNNVHQHVKVLHKRVFELKKFMEDYISNQIMDTKIQVSVDNALFNIDPITGLDIPTSDLKHIGATDILTKALNSLKMYINDTLSIVAPFETSLIDPADPNFDLTNKYKTSVKGILDVKNISSFEKGATFKEAVVFDKEINVPKILVQGKELKVIRGIIPGTYVTGNGTLVNTASSNGFYAKELTTILYPGQTAVTGFFTTDNIHRTFYVVESLDSVNIKLFYSVKIRTTVAISGSQYGLIELGVKQKINNIGLDEYVARVQGITPGKPMGYNYSTKDSFVLGNQAASSLDNTTGSVAWTPGSNPLAQARLINIPQLFAGISDGSIQPNYANTAAVLEQNASHVLYINPATTTGAFMEVCSGIKQLVLYQTPVGTEFFINYHFDLQFEKNNL